MNRCRLSNKVKLTLKRGTVVDPDSGQKEAHVYTESGIKYTAVLSKIEIQTENKNSYYKLQLLESDKGSNYWVFLSWGRIGTNIGDNKLENFNNVDLAQKAFFKQYKEKTGNKWNSQDRFEKLPGYYYPIEIDYGSDLIKLIFDEKAMNKVVLEFELNTQKMPLGKLSKKQIQSAYDVLNELQTLINESDPEVLKFIDASNKFYTFVPHSFGVDAPPVLKDTETIKQKIVMLDSFMEMEIAYTVKASGSEHTDGFYTEIDVLSPESEEFKIIETYSKNTHGEPHNNFSLDIKNIHTIKRHGEDKRFEAFKKLHNHKLLWHDYKTTSLAEILTQGLRIAPPEAPVDDYMFGKGIYFADMVSKSANYYCTTPDNSTGLLLLCDVALGNMYERTQAEYVKKLPEDKHSTKGIGRIEPDPKSSKTLEGIEVPIGKGVASEKISSALPYNKYIVYDVAQVNVKYLLRVDFKNV
jgi:predicted DNA-binding WGR domain protein